MNLFPKLCAAVFAIVDSAPINLLAQSLNFHNRVVGFNQPALNHALLSACPTIVHAAINQNVLIVPIRNSVPILLRKSLAVILPAIYFSTSVSLIYSTLAQFT
ncbi:MAG: hypothetical protein WCP92_04615 [bacterium]